MNGSLLAGDCVAEIDGVIVCRLCTRHGLIVCVTGGWFAGVGHVHQSAGTPDQAGRWNHHVSPCSCACVCLSHLCFRSIAVRRVAFADTGDRADLYIRTSLKRSSSGVMQLRLPMLVMRVEKVPSFPLLCAFPQCVVCFWSTHHQEGSKLIKKKFQLRDMSIDANTVSGALKHPMPPTASASFLTSVRESR
jgi:hypothetical protein